MDECEKMVEERFRDIETSIALDKFSDKYFLKRFGASVAERRKLLKLSQEEFASRAGLHRSYVSDLERGARNIGTTNLIHIARALGLPAWLLMARAEMNNGRVS